MKYPKLIGRWVLQLLLAVLMAGPGSQKFTSPAWERMFRAWGYPDGFYLVIGATQVVGGIGLLIPRAASYCAIVLSMVMVGASATQIFRGDRNGIFELVLAALLGVIATLRWRDRWRARAPVSATVSTP